MGRSNYELKPVRAHHFLSPLCTEANHRCYSSLLRAVADWLDKHSIEDPEVEDIVLKTQFTGDDDTYYEAATVYYREKEF